MAQARIQEGGREDGVGHGVGGIQVVLITRGDIGRPVGAGGMVPAAQIPLVEGDADAPPRNPPQR